MCLPKKDAYKMTKENDKIRKQVQEFLDKGLISESLSPCVVPCSFNPKERWEMDDVYRF